jgi:hypothetical protein
MDPGSRPMTEVERKIGFLALTIAPITFQVLHLLRTDVVTSS